MNWLNVISGYCTEHQAQNVAKLVQDEKQHMSQYMFIFSIKKLLQG